MRRLILALLLFAPVSAMAQWGGGFVPKSHSGSPPSTCLQGVAFNDLCPAAPVAGKFVFSPATVFSGYAARPPWNVAGVDFPVGYTTAVGSLKDWSTAALPSGCVKAGNNVTCSTANTTIAGYDFGLHNGGTLICNAANLTVQNNHFLVGTNNLVPVGGNILGNVIVANNSCSGMSIINNEVDGGGQAVTSQQGQTLNFVANGGGTWTVKYNYMHASGGDMINWGSGNSIIINAFANFFKDIGTNTDHSDTFQFCSQVVGSGSRMSFNYVWQTVDQPGAGNGLFVQLSECAGMTMASLDVSNNGAAALAACVTCNWLFGFYDDLGATSANVSIRNNYGDPTGLFVPTGLFTQSAWFGINGPGIPLNSINIAHPSVFHDLTNMVSGASIPVPSAGSPNAGGYSVYPDGSGYTPSLSDIFAITAAPASGNRVTGNTVVFTLAMAVLPWTVTGSPTLSLSGTGSPTAVYTSGSGTNTLTFTYTVLAGQTATNLTVTAINP
jgi:hypothetical protein